MKNERVDKFFEGLLHFGQQEKPEEKEVPTKGEKTEKAPASAPAKKETTAVEDVPIEGTEEIDTEEQLSTVDKVYRLKKIYAKLIAISRLLDYHSDSKFDDLRDKILEAVDLFHIIVSNFDSFKENIDNIIKSYYDLLQKSIEELEKLSNKKEEIK